MTEYLAVKPKDRDTILLSLRAGVVPRTGFQHIQVGRNMEVQSLARDMDRIADGGSAFRFIIGEFGSGKTFFLFLIRSIALGKRLVTVHADLTPDRRLHSSGGHARSLYKELMRNMATRATPDGGAVASVVERFVTTAVTDARQRGVACVQCIQERLSSLSEMVGGYDFAEVVNAYWTGHETGNDQRQSAAVRWLRGEYATRTDARADLGVRTIVEDSNVYDHLKLLAHFVRLAGYSGLLVCLDEMVNLYKLANTQARTSNYEQILSMLNDSLQGSAVGLGFALGGTPDFLLDTRKGLYSYPALASRLAENEFARAGLVDYSGPIIRLQNLAREDLFILLQKLRHVQASGDPGDYTLPDDGIKSFMAHCSKRLGDAYFRSPRNTIVSFLNLLAILEQYRSISWEDQIERVHVVSEINTDLLAPLDDDTNPSPARTPEQQTVQPDDELTTFKL